MAGRKQKNTVDFFPHYGTPEALKLKRHLFKTFGHLGYACFYALMEILAGSDEHYLDLSTSLEWHDTLVALDIEEETGKAFVDFMVEFGKIDADLWVEKKIVWCQEFVDNLHEAYRKRKGDLPQKPFAQSFSAEEFRKAANPTDQPVVEMDKTLTIIDNPFTNSDLPIYPEEFRNAAPKVEESSLKKINLKQRRAEGSECTTTTDASDVSDETPSPPPPPEDDFFDAYTERIDDYWNSGDIEDNLAMWEEAYPDLDVPAEIRRARGWLQSNTDKQKSNFRSFLNHWFSRARKGFNQEENQNTNGVDEDGYQIPEVIRRASYS